MCGHPFLILSCRLPGPAPPRMPPVITLADDQPGAVAQDVGVVTRVAYEGCVAVADADVDETADVADDLAGSGAIQRGGHETEDFIGEAGYAGPAEQRS